MEHNAGRAVLYDDSGEQGQAYTRVVAALADWPGPRPYLVIDDHFCSGEGNPYWDSDDVTVQLELSAADTVVLARLLGTEVDRLPESVTALLSTVASDGRDAVNQMIRFCDEHGLPWRTVSANPRDELGGGLRQHTSNPPPG